MPFVMEKSKSKKGASLSKEFASFNSSSVGYMTYHFLEKKRLLILSKIPRYLDAELNASKTSA